MPESLTIDDLAAKLDALQARRDAVLKIRFCANKECFGWVPKGSRYCVACNYERHRTKRDRKRVKLGTRRKGVANAR